MEAVMSQVGPDDAVAAGMKARTADLKTKSDKIRALGKAGYTRRQIADFLAISYQHVRNVLVDEVRRSKAGLASRVPPQPATSAIKPINPPEAVKVELGPDGGLALPPHICEALALKQGDALWLTLEQDEVRVSTAKAVTRRIRAVVREYVPAGVSLVDELIEERRQETAARELRGEEDRLKRIP
jgi:bifunctional DNA-binding transcriptional regulator/antitoxin component of YhaV-PrlF toxin-antitoxin module